MAGDTSDVERLIEGLVSDERYAELSQSRPGFDLFEILGGLTENPSSRVLAFLLDSGERHGLGDAFYNALLRELHRSEAVAGRRFVLRFQVGMIPPELRPKRGKGHVEQEFRLADFDVGAPDGRVIAALPVELAASRPEGQEIGPGASGLPYPSAPLAAFTPTWDSVNLYGVG